ncbi:hypothetical protein SAMN02745729_1283 [Marinobacterium iners DSM 11526]|uniref:Uncharacterized protein n=1 Tax=Marinobacterium iners DSM 11526 TaxID=1122198 RepID=A0A1H4H4Q8_9GAMM|nr:hypothetical protein SAMN02745729_1283 [Marinobacterium iners DSM 11526]
MERVSACWPFQTVEAEDKRERLVSKKATQRIHGISFIRKDSGMDCAS